MQEPHLDSFARSRSRLLKRRRCCGRGSVLISFPKPSCCTALCFFVFLERTFSFSPRDLAHPYTTKHPISSTSAFWCVAIRLKLKAQALKRTLTKFKQSDDDSKGKHLMTKFSARQAKVRTFEAVPQICKKIVTKRKNRSCSLSFDYFFRSFEQFNFEEKPNLSSSSGFEMTSALHFGKREGFCDECGLEAERLCGGCKIAM